MPLPSKVLAKTIPNSATAPTPGRAITPKPPIKPSSPPVAAPAVAPAAAPP